MFMQPMQPIKLTEDQKTHIKAVNRNNEQLQATWHLYTMFLGGHMEPRLALRLAIEAMEAWIPYQDENLMAHPEIDIPQQIEQPPLDIEAMITKYAGMMMQAILKAKQEHTGAEEREQREEQWQDHTLLEKFQDDMNKRGGEGD